MKLSVDDHAPEFTLPDQNGDTHSLADYRGDWLLLYFYPKDMTPGCTKEACTLRDHYGDFKRENVKIVGVSTDTVDSHKKFENKHDLPFTLLADANKEIVKKYGVWGEKRIFGKTVEGTKRTSFLIDPDGTIAKIYTGVKPSAHAEEVLADVKVLKQKE